MKITDLEPKPVFKFFEDIAAIPHGSGNTEAIAEYCMSFAKERGLRCSKDEGGNVVIFKGGTEGYEDSPSVILQGHLDMVCEKLPGCSKNMETEGIDIFTDGEYVTARETTLGADDGIAVAYILAVLDSKDVPHPPIEALLTNDEETGMVGANNLDPAGITGRRLINIDSEEEGVLMVSCAGGVRVYCGLDLSFEETGNREIKSFEIEVDGLKGGHSGIDIDKHRTNAAKLLARLLCRLNSLCLIGISEIESGGKVNVIPGHGKAVVCTSAENGNLLLSAASEFRENIKAELSATEPNADITIREVAPPQRFTTAESTSLLIFTLMQAPDGVEAMSPEMPDMVQTSLNMGTVSIDGDRLKTEFMIRSNDSFGKARLSDRLRSLIEYVGGDVRFEADYPPWEYRKNSPLRNTMVEVYRELFGKEPQVTGIHAGLECGILAKKLNGADMISFGPDLENVHTPRERMNVKSAQRCWNYLLKVLEKLK